MTLDVNEKLNQYLDEWKNDAPNEYVVETLSKYLLFVYIVFYFKLNHFFFKYRISDIIEKETEAYYKMDPDPFDDRHPSRAKPTCSFGPLLKNLFKNDDFMNKVEYCFIINDF